MRNTRRLTLKAEGQKRNAECETQNAERETQNAERLMPNAKSTKHQAQRRIGVLNTKRAASLFGNWRSALSVKH